MGVPKVVGIKIVLVGIEGVVEKGAIKGVMENVIKEGSAEGVAKLISGYLVIVLIVDKAGIPGFEVCFDNAIRFRAMLVVRAAPVAPPERPVRPSRSRAGAMRCRPSLSHSEGSSIVLERLRLAGREVMRQKGRTRPVWIASTPRAGLTLLSTKFYHNSRRFPVWGSKGNAVRGEIPNAAAAPATVSGESFVICHWESRSWEGDAR